MPIDSSNVWLEIDEWLRYLPLPQLTVSPRGDSVIIDRGEDPEHGRYYVYSTYIEVPNGTEKYVYVGNQYFYEDGTQYVDPIPKQVLLN